ncbi:MAG TPA: class I SAM-dependent methyltransferase [Candidatus Acidoferrales bacterium]|nr:class I SAM-dependent methyltransferase [Candidatus Acidoferrales bacterium]
MRAGRPSRTADRVALRRAAHQLIDHPLVLEDPIAIPLLGAEQAAALRADPRGAQAGPFAAHLRAFLVVRSRLTEDLLADHVARGLAQYVVLGAGLDSFAYRNPHPGLRVFEIDHPATQAFKRERLAQAGITPPPSLRYVPVDFERDRLDRALEGAGLDPSRPAFFSWLGVVPYLERAAIRATFAVVVAATRAGGALVFDYGLKPSRLPFAQRLVVEAFAARLRAAGEPWLSFFDPPELAQELRAAGFEGVDDWDRERLTARYLAHREDDLVLGGAGRIAVASRPLARPAGT